MNGLGRIVYGLVDSRTNEIRYVGKTERGMSRPRMHLTKRGLAERTHKANWVRSLLAAGGTCRIVILQRCDNADELNDAERKWIAIGRAALGPRLTNATDGGEGCSGRVPTEEEREKISRAQRGRPLTKEHCASLSAAKKGRPLSDKARAIIATRARSPECRAKNSVAHIGQLVSKQTRAKISAYQRTRPMTEARRRQLDEAREKRNTPENRAKHLAAVRAAMTPEVCAKVSAAKLKYWADRRASK